MVDCSQRVALVLGGAGNVGSGVVGGFLRRGYRKVVVVSRDPVRMNKLRQHCCDDRLVCILGDIGSEASAEAARQEVVQHCSEVNDIVSAIGFSWWQKGPLVQQSKLELESTLNSLVVAPFVAYKTFIHLVKDNPTGTYTFVTGENRGLKIFIRKVLSTVLVLCAFVLLMFSWDGFFKTLFLPAQYELNDF